MTPVSPCAPWSSMYSAQPTMPSSVVILRNEFTRQPASQCRSSTLTIFIDRPPPDSNNLGYLADVAGTKQGEVQRVRRHWQRRHVSRNRPDGADWIFTLR